MSEFLEAALTHQHEGRSVVAVNKEKTPYKGHVWKPYLTRPQTEEEVKQEFSNNVDGIALILYPSCVYTVLDFDGIHADQAWAQTKIELPETAQNKTRSGGKHLYFRMPQDVPNFPRSVRIVRASKDYCQCVKHGKPALCGVDLLLNGYALIPPSPGYSEDPDHPLESAVVLPQKIIDLAVKMSEEPPRKTGEGPQNKVSQGQRKAVIVSLAGTMRRRGMSIESVQAALEADNEIRFDPPLTRHEIQDVLKSTEKWGVPDALEHLTDSGNARRFENIHRSTVLYVSERIKWFLWNGELWEVDHMGIILDYAHATIQSIHAEAGLIDDEQLRKAVASHAMKSEARSKIKAMMELAEALPSIRSNIDRFDQQPYLLNATNCTIDLRTADTHPFSQNDFLTRMIPTKYDPNAKCPRFREFLDKITLEDTDLQKFILRSIGCCLTGDTGDRTMFICYGDGSNGKSTLLNVIHGILGKDYAQEIKTDVLMQQHNNNSADYYLAELHGARFVTASEPGRRKVLKTELIKQATGGDPLPVRRPYERPFTFIPEFKLWLSTNHKPIIPDTGDAIWDRLALIPFNKKFPDDSSRIKNYWNVLLEERSGILNLLIEGLLDWKQNGLTRPDVIKTQTKEYRKEEDIIQTYIDDRNIFDPETYVETSLHYADYKKWAEDHHEFVESSTAFGISMREKNFTTKLLKVDRKTFRIRPGIRLKFTDE